MTDRCLFSAVITEAIHRLCVLEQSSGQILSQWKSASTETWVSHTQRLFFTSLFSLSFILSTVMEKWFNDVLWGPVCNFLSSSLREPCRRHSDRIRMSNWSAGSGPRTSTIKLDEQRYEGACWGTGANEVILRNSDSGLQAFLTTLFKSPKHLTGNYLLFPSPV